MVRTADRNVRVVGGKSSGKKGGGGGTSSSSTPVSSSSKGGYSSASIGGNPVCPRETPAWQKPITNFFRKDESYEPKSHRIEIGESSKSCSNVLAVDTNDNIAPDPEKEKKDKVESTETNTNENEEKEEVKAKTSPIIVTAKSTENIVDNKTEKSEVNEDVECPVDAKTETAETKSEDDDKSAKNVEDTKENERTDNSCKTPRTEKKRRGNHINILTPKRIKGQY